MWVSPGYCSCECSSSSTTIFKCYCLSLERYWGRRELQNHLQIALVSWFSFCKPFSSNWQRWKHVWSAFHKSCLLDSTQDPRAVAIHGRVCNFFNPLKLPYIPGGWQSLARTSWLFCLLHTLFLRRIARLVWMFFLSRCGWIRFFFMCMIQEHFLSKFETECHRTCMNMESHSWFTKHDIQHLW